MYGVLSERIHIPDLTKVIVSDKSSQAYKDFFEYFGEDEIS